MHTLPHLPDSIAHEVFATLANQLPAPVPDNPDARASQLDYAMQAVAALHPDDAFEAMQATEIVIAKAHAGESFRIAALLINDAAGAHRHRAQAISLLRQSESGLRSFRRERAARDKAFAERHPAAMERAGYWFRDVSIPAPDPAPAEAAPPPPADPPKREFKDMTEAEQYAVNYPKRAALIRAHGGLPPNLDFGPPRPALVRDILASKSPILLALDPPEAKPHAA